MDSLKDTFIGGLLIFLAVFPVVYYSEGVVRLIFIGVGVLLLIVWGLVGLIR